ncbi:hypothetical protein J6590_105606, partial [Homalodisca vitripennis]
AKKELKVPRFPTATAAIKTLEAILKVLSKEGFEHVFKGWQGAPPRGGLLCLGTIRGPVPPVVGIALTVTSQARDSTTSQVVTQGSEVRVLLTVSEAHSRPRVQSVPLNVQARAVCLTYSPERNQNPLQKYRKLGKSSHGAEEGRSPVLTLHSAKTDQELRSSGGRILNFSFHHPVAYFIVSDNNYRVIYLVKVGVDTLRFLGGRRFFRWRATTQI